MDAAVALSLADEAATRLFGTDLAAALLPGDVVALEGDLGAGKTTLARALIRALAADPALEVPSPTYTLVQRYETRPPVHHFDLYRLSAPDELDELGLAEAVAEGIVLVEWPERAAGRMPESAVTVAVTDAGAGRGVRIAGPEPVMERIRRSLAIRAFLAESGHPEAERRHLVGDASSRAYETIEDADEVPRILMNAPRRPDGPPIRNGMPYSRIAHLAESVTPFVALAGGLRRAGFAAPDVFAQDLDGGLLLIEHLGAERFVPDGGAPDAARYAAAAELLAALHRMPWPRSFEAAPGIRHRVPAYDREAMMIETGLLADWYIPFVLERPADAGERAAWRQAWETVLDGLDGAETSLVLRDYHSPNLIWRGDREGTDRIGVIDFQDAVIGPSAYDVASLAMDARVDMSEAMERATVEAYCAARAGSGPFDRAGFARDYAVMAAQRNAKILGIFVRLDRRDGKPHYLRHLPRIRAYLGRALRHPALGPVREFAESRGLLGRTDG